MAYWSGWMSSLDFRAFLQRRDNQSPSIRNAALQRFVQRNIRIWLRDEGLFTSEISLNYIDRLIFAKLSQSVDQFSIHVFLLLISH